MQIAGKSKLAKDTVLPTYSGYIEVAEGEEAQTRDRL